MNKGKLLFDRIRITGATVQWDKKGNEELL